MKKKLSFAILALLIFFCFSSAVFSDASDGVAHVWGPVSTEDYFVVGVAAGLLCAMIAMIPISQRWLKTRRGRL
jgi:hypothetical protein